MVEAPPPPLEVAVADLQAAHLQAAYRGGALTPVDVIAAVYERIAARGNDGVWITLVPRDEALERARALTASHRDGDRPPGPLYGLPFAVKDNIDVAGLPTTAACPDFAYRPAGSAPLVERLLAAGAICIGKTNLDQFATGLTGTRSPYGTPRSPFGPDLIPGGSSSGSGVAVAVGLVTFAIGTDTAGSGRVPAALTNTVGVKPTFGLVSGRGLVPACRSLDCPSVFALSVPDAAAVLSVLAGYDPADPWSRRLPDVPAVPGPPPAHPRVGIIAGQDLEFFGDADAAAAYAHAVAHLSAAGARCVPVDFAPFLAAGELLYEGPWLAERAAAVGGYVDAHPDQVQPVTRAVLAPAATVSGADVFRGLARLRALRRRVDDQFAALDLLVLPTVPTACTRDQVAADPIALNARMGRYTTFTNLLDLAAVAVPTGFAGSIPRGVTVMAPAGSDALLAAVAADLHRRVALPVGAGGSPLAAVRVATPDPGSAGPATDPGSAGPAADPGSAGPDGPSHIELAVVGAHMTGLPLNGQLTALGSTFVRRTTTAPHYRLFALPGSGPARPGLVRVPTGGTVIEAEVWRLPAPALGAFLAGIPAPLGIGRVELLGAADDAADGARGMAATEPTLGFLCEAWATADARDISEHGGWRAFLAHATADAHADA